MIQAARRAQDEKAAREEADRLAGEKEQSLQAEEQARQRAENATVAAQASEKLARRRHYEYQCSPPIWPWKQTTSQCSNAC